MIRNISPQNIIICDTASEFDSLESVPDGVRVICKETHKAYVCVCGQCVDLTAAGSFTGTLDDITTGSTNVHLTTALKSTYDGLATNSHASGSDNQDLSGLEPKETGKHLSSNDYTTAEQSKLSGIESGANNYAHPANHAPSIVTQDVSNRFVTDTEKSTWNGKETANANIQAHVTSAHAPSTAQANVDITQAEIEAKLTGAISSHSHTGGSDPFPIKLVLTADKPTGANVTPINTGLTFSFEANSKYVIDIYALVAPTAATTGCGFSLDVSAGVTYVGTFVSHQLAATGTLSGSGSIGDLGATSAGASSGMVSTGIQTVLGGGILITTTNAGTATLFFRSEVTAVTTLKAGTMIRVMKMA